MKIYIVKKEHVNKLVPMSSAIKAMKNIFFQNELKKINSLQRSIIELQNPNSLALIMPAYNLNTGILGVKISSIVSQNLTIGLPLIHSLMLIVDEKDGQIKALVDGVAVTRLRTGATCGLATELLTEKKVSKLAIIGAGNQSYSIVEAICNVRKISKITLFSRTVEKAKLLKEFIISRFFITDVSITENSGDAVRNADIICTATSNTSRDSVINLEDIPLDRKVLVIAIGGANLEARELPLEIYTKANVIVEDVDAAINECGEISSGIEENIIDRSRLITLGKLVKNKVNLKNNLAIFRSVGMAIEDVAIIQEIMNSSQLEKQCQFITMD